MALGAVFDLQQGNLVMRLGALRVLCKTGRYLYYGGNLPPRSVAPEEAAWRSTIFL